MSLYVELNSSINSRLAEPHGCANLESGVRGLLSLIAIDAELLARKEYFRNSVPCGSKK